jgi:NRPS condensation-like uncharacterized protein
LNPAPTSDERRPATIVLPVTESGSELLRPLGASERMFHRFSERSSIHFCQVAEFGGVIELEQLRTALAAVQQRHPLLTVHIEDSPDTRLGFYRDDQVRPLPLRLVPAGDGLRWQDVVAQELAVRFDPGTAPLARVVLLQQANGHSVVVLTFDHTVADARAAVTVLDDLTVALNGRTLAALPVPRSQEDQMDDVFADAGAAAPFEPPTGPAFDPRATDPFEMRWDDDAVPTVSSIELDEQLTSRVISGAREHGTTVHGMIVAAAVRARAADGDREVVRVMSPIDLRPLLGTAGDVVGHLSAVRTGVAPELATSFWDTARVVSATLAGVRAAPVMRSVSGLQRDMLPTDADGAAGVHFMLFAVGWDLHMSNLGVVSLSTAPETGALLPTAIWGPVLQGHIQGESMLGITTYRGQLRITHTTQSSRVGLLDAIQDELVTATAA